MANTPKWNVRLRHEWLAKPSKGRRVKQRGAKRIGLAEAWDRKRDERERPAEPETASEETSSEG